MITHLIGNKKRGGNNNTLLMSYETEKRNMSYSVGTLLKRRYPHFVRINPQIAVNPNAATIEQDGHAVTVIVGERRFKVTPSCIHDVLAVFDLTAPPRRHPRYYGQITKGKILDSLSSNEEFNLTQIANNTHLSITTVYNWSKRLQQSKVVVRRREGTSVFIRLNNG